MRPNPISITALLQAPVAAGCAQAPVQQDGITISDPYEARNRSVHALSKRLDAGTIDPVMNGLKGDSDDAARDPDAPIRLLQMVINAGRKLSPAVKVVKELLQGRSRDTGANLNRFAVD